MKLLVMRHGIAEVPRRDDDSRTLTEAGIDGVRKSAKALFERQLMPSKVYASPLIRAQQTAALMRDHLCPNQSIRTLYELRPEAGVLEAYKRLGSAVEHDVCLLVSHQPFVSLFIQYLSKVDIYMDTADICCIKMETFGPYCGDIEWHFKAR